MAFTRILESDRVVADRVNQLGDEISAELDSAIGQNASDLNEHKADFANYKLAKAFKGTLIRNKTAQSIPDAVNTVLVLGEIQYNLNGIWSPDYPTRLSVPSGATKVRLIGNVAFASNPTGYRQVEILKNGVSYNGKPRVVSNPTPLSFFINVASPVLTVGAGDYFEISCYQNSGGALNIFADNSTWFALEVIE